MTDGLSQLPKAPADRFTRPFLRFIRIEAYAGAALVLCASAALLLANSAWSARYLSLWELPLGISIGDFTYARSLRHWINDGLMTLFFFVVALELKRETMLGELRNPRLAALPLAGAVGGMIVPAGVYLMLAGSGPDASGWGTVVSTDTAFVIGCLALLGTRVPGSLRLFLLSLAIFDDIGAIVVVAVGYGGRVDWIALGLAASGFALIAGLGYAGIRSVAVYVGLGACTWLALEASGVHATLTGVVLGLMTPARSWVSGVRLKAILARFTALPDGNQGIDDAGRHEVRRAAAATREALSPIERLEFSLHPWVAFGVLPLFALANAGFPIVPGDLDARLTAAVFAGFVIGKPAGVLIFTMLAVRFQLALLPRELSWALVAAGGLLTGIGFTMALLIADLAFSVALLASVKLGILASSITSAAAGLLALTWLTAPDRHSRGGHEPRPASGS